MTDPREPLRVDEVDSVDDGDWEALLARDPHSSVLQRPAVLRILASALPGVRPRWLEARSPDGNLRGGLGMLRRHRMGLLQVVSGAVGLYGGPVLDPESGTAAGTGLAAAFQRSGGLRTVTRELVWAGHDPPGGVWTGLRPLRTAVLDTAETSDFDGWFESRLRPSRRKERRRVARRGFRAVVARDSSFLESFHPLYIERCARWKTRPLGLGCLQELLDSGPQWIGFVVLDGEDELVGAHLCIDLGPELFAWLGTARRITGGSAAALLIEAELRWCCEHGRERLNLGASADLTGVSEFKRGISARDDPRWIIRWRRGRGFA